VNVTKKIVAGKHNKLYVVPIKEMLNWYPADFTRQCYICPSGVIYHNCIKPRLQWDYVMDINRNDDRYVDIFKSIQRDGFVAPVRAKISEDDHVILLDGHNRVGVAWDMSLEKAPVYVADKDTELDDLKAPDSGIWTKNHKPWTEAIGR
jgi:hypothetical protein